MLPCRCTCRLLFAKILKRTQNVNQRCSMLAKINVLILSRVEYRSLLKLGIASIAGLRFVGATSKDENSHEKVLVTI